MIDTLDFLRALTFHGENIPWRALSGGINSFCACGKIAKSDDAVITIFGAHVQRPNNTAKGECIKSLGRAMIQQYEYDHAAHASSTIAP